jgi:hypothetical protein
VVKAEAAVFNHDASLARDRAELAALIKQHKGIGATRENKQSELEKCESSLVRAEADAAEAETRSAAAMETYQNAMAGKVGDEGSADTLSLPEQVPVVYTCLHRTGLRYFRRLAPAPLFVTLILTLSRSPSLNLNLNLNLLFRVGRTLGRKSTRGRQSAHTG